MTTYQAVQFQSYPGTEISGEGYIVEKVEEKHYMIFGYLFEMVRRLKPEGEFSVAPINYHPDSTDGIQIRVKW